MPTNINFDKILGISKQTSIIPTSTTPVCPSPPAFVDTNSFEFDGTTSYFNGNGVKYGELDNQTKLTLSFWVKPTTSTFRTVFSIANGSAVAGEAQVLCFLDASNRVRITFGATTNNLFSEVDSIQVGFWNHVFIAIDLAQGAPSLEGRVYIDGIDKTDTVNLSSLTQFDVSTGDIYIGDDALNYQGKFLGYINELAIWPGEDYRNSYQDVFNLGLPNDLNNLPTNPIGQTPVAPNAWFRMGEVATYGGSQWVMRDVNNCYYLYSTGIAGPPAQPTTDIPLFNNKSFVFDGTTDYVDCGNNANLQPTTEVSVSAWFKSSSLTRQTIASRTYYRLRLLLTGELEWAVYENSSTAVFAATSGVNYADNQWHNVVCTHQTNGRSKIYVDGTLQADIAGLTTNIFNTPIEFLIGRRNFSVSQFFIGNIDEVAVWTSELSAAEATAIYNGGVPNDLSGLSPVSWWRMGEDSVYNSGPGLWSFPDNGSGGNNGSSLTFPEAARVSDVPT